MHRYAARFRDEPTALSYGAVAAYAFWLYAFGPALALLRSELHFSYALLGAYSALWSAGAAVAGMSFAALARRLRRDTLLWLSAAAATAGAGLFAAFRTVEGTAVGTALLGFAGTTLLTCTQAILSDRHGERRDRALTEANVGAAACAVLAPPLLGLLQATQAGWRAAMALPALALAGLYLRYRRRPLPAVPGVDGPRADGPTRLSWPSVILAALVAVGVAVEFCVVYFGAELLAGAGLRTAAAATAMSGFYLGILAGRVGGAWLTRRARRTAGLLWACLAVCAAGFAVFWLAALPAPAIAGLFLCGVGVANLYPLSLSLALASAPGNADRVNGAAQLLSGVLVIASPYLLGSLADRLGLHTAFAVEPVLLGGCAILLLAARPGGRRRGSAGPLPSPVAGSGELVRGQARQRAGPAPRPGGRVIRRAGRRGRSGRCAGRGRTR